MTWLRRNILLLVALAVLGYMLIPNLVVALFSFNDPVGPLQLHVAAVLGRGLGQPLWRPGHLRVAGPVARRSG